MADGDVGADQELMEDAASARQDSAQPLKAEAPTKARTRSHNRAPYEREAREISPARRSLSRARITSRSPSPSPSTIPDCYNVTSDVEDEYLKTRSTAQLNKEIREHRQTIASAIPGSKLVENLTVDKDKLSSIVLRRKSPEQREILCARKMLALRNEIDRKLKSVVKCEAILEIVLQLQDQAARDKAAEVPNQERIERLLNEINEAPRIIERLTQARREDLLNRLRGVQLLPSSVASQEAAAVAGQLAPPRGSQT